MAIYGSMIKESTINNNAMSLDEFFDFIQESDKQMEIMFEKTDLIQVLKEENSSLSIPTKISFDGNPETVKKTVIQKIKELVDKFVQMVKEAFAKLTKKLQELYNKTNLIDKLVSDVGEKYSVSFQYLQAAREKGWKGVPISIPMIQKLADLKDSALYEDLEKGLGNKVKINTDSDIRPIITSESLEEAKEKYNAFMDKLNKIKEEEKSETVTNFLLRKETDRKLNFDGNAVLRAYFVITDDRYDKDHYYPNAQGFAKTAKFAEEGQSRIKYINQSCNNVINNFKLKRETSLSNLKSAKNGENSETEQINILYCKAIYQTVSQKVSHASRILRVMMSILRMQHTYAIQGYLQYVYAIKHYVLNNNA